MYRGQVNVKSAQVNAWNDQVNVYGRQVNGNSTERAARTVRAAWLEKLNFLAKKICKKIFL